MSIEAMKLALEALNTPRPEDNYPPLWRAYSATIDNAINTLRQAIEQSTEQEPVAYGTWDTMLGKGRMMMVRLDKGQDGCTVPLYTQPQKAVLVEREACAKVLDNMADDMAREMEPSTAIAYVRSKAAAIRARGNT